MSDVMHVVCLEQTGHVLAAIAAKSGGEPPELEALTGPVLEVTASRSQTAGTAGIRPMRSPVPVDLLELKTAPLDRGAIANPLHYTIDGGAVVRLPDVAPPAAALPLTTDTITLTGNIADVVGMAVVCDAGDPSGERRIQSGTFVDDGGLQPLVLPLTLLPDDTPAALTAGNDYDIMFAIQGIRLFWGADMA